MDGGKTGTLFILESCPFCGSDNIELNSTRPGTEKIPRVCWVNCNNCDATGPDSGFPEEATVLWEKRS